MLNHNFVKIITILIFSLFFYPSVYANMQVMSEDDLTQIEAEGGITLVLDQDVYLKSDGFSFYTETVNKNEGIVFSSFLIDKGTGTYATPVPFDLNSTVLLDLGTSAGRTWLNISGFNIYNRIGITVGTGSYTGVKIEDGANDRYLGDLQIRGLFMGRNLTTTDPGSGGGYNGVNFTGTTTPYFRLATHAGGAKGIELFMDMNLYVDSLTFINSSTAANRMTVSGIYVGQTCGGTMETPSTWTMSGNLQGIAGSPPTIDVGTAGGKTYLYINLPMVGEIRVKEFKMDGVDATHNFGPIVLKDIRLRTASFLISSY